MPELEVKVVQLYSIVVKATVLVTGVLQVEQVAMVSLEHEEPALEVLSKLAALGSGSVTNRLDQKQEGISKEFPYHTADCREAASRGRISL
jgi:hypothetical protein